MDEDLVQCNTAAADGMSDQPRQETLGYCVRCGTYGRGEYAGVINSHSDAIRNHRGCNEAQAASPNAAGPSTG
ncbi:hypothetical protein CG736_28400 [Kitasatospora sp. CB02891]|nr:hypothetical protein CG736_28400 [Kitasatospora sp. CB02891]